MNNFVLTLLSDLIAFPSITPNHAGSLTYIEQLTQKLGGKSIKIERNQTSNLIVSFGRGNVTFAFAGHVDVVPPGNLLGWHNNPFELYKDGDNLIARGVADMKGAIAGFLIALSKFITLYDQNHYKILLLLTSDEEGTATDGTRIIVEHLQNSGTKLDYCIIGEPSSSNVLGDTIKIGRRGSLTGELTINGKQGHIAYPELCINSIHNALPVLSDLIKYNWDTGNKFFPPTSLQFANINSGLGITNVIPGQLTTNFNLRYNNIHTIEDLKIKTQQILSKYKLDYELNWYHSAQPFITKIGRLCEITKDSIMEVCGIESEYRTDGGTSDGRFLTEISDELLELGFRNNSIHQINESILYSELDQLTKIYYSILCKIFNDQENKKT